MSVDYFHNSGLVMSLKRLKKSMTWPIAALLISLRIEGSDGILSKVKIQHF